MGYLGWTSCSIGINKLELKSWRNFYLTDSYSYQFDPTVSTISDEEKALFIEAGKAKKAQRDAEKKKVNRAAKALRRQQRAKDRATTSTSNE